MEEAHLTGVGRGFQRDGAAYAKQRLPNPSKRHLGTLRRFLFSDRRGLVYGGVEGPPHIFFDIMLSHTDDIVTRP